jgi:hypothetical protein
MPSAGSDKSAASVNAQNRHYARWPGASGLPRPASVTPDLRVSASQSDRFPDNQRTGKVRTVDGRARPVVKIKPGTREIGHFQTPTICAGS